MKETRLNDPDLPDDLELLRQAAEIVFNISKHDYMLAMIDRRTALMAAERAVSNWEARRQAQLAKCGDVAACTNLRCRRSKQCMTLPWISAKCETSRLRLATERAKWPTQPEAEASPPPESKKKGRTRMRP